MRTPFVSAYKTLYVPGSIIARLVARLYEKGIRISNLQANPPDGRVYSIEVRIEDFDYVDRVARWYYFQRNSIRGLLVILFALLLIGTLNGLF